MRYAIAWVALSAFVSTARGQTPDHLKCYKIKDSAPRARYAADLAGPAVEPGCVVQVPGRLLCVQTAKTNVQPTPPGAADGGPAGRFVCYKVRCPRAAVAPIAVSDQFGSRTVQPRAAQLLCAPEGTGAVTTTSSSTSSSVPSPSSTTGPPVSNSSSTSTTSTTLSACAADVPACAAACPDGGTCAAYLDSSFQTACRCFYPSQPCGDTYPVCNGACPDGSVCGTTVPGVFGGCGCVPAGTTACTDAGGFPSCGGSCPDGTVCGGVDLQVGAFIHTSGCACGSGAPCETGGIACPPGQYCYGAAAPGISIRYCR